MEISEVPCPYCGVMLEKEDPGGDRIFVAECQCKYDWIRCKFCGAPLKPGGTRTADSTAAQTRSAWIQSTWLIRCAGRCKNPQRPKKKGGVSKWCWMKSHGA